MIPPSLRRLEACHVDMIDALDSNDVEAILACVQEFRETVDEVRAIGGWRETPEVAELVTSIFRLSEAARVRVNFLTDVNQRRIEALAAARGRSTGITYRRDGSQAA